MFDKGLFGGMFDFNGDGKLDSFEKAAEFSFFMQMMEEREKTNESKAESSDNSGYSSTEYSTDLEDALDDAGIDPYDFELMDSDEQAEALSDAGYDIDDFDF